MNNRLCLKLAGLIFLSIHFVGILASEKERLGSAISSNQIAVVRQLLQNNPTLVNADLGAQFRPLHYAAESGFVDIAQLLINLGANVNAQNQQGQTPLYLAASEGRTALVKLLLDHGANKNLRDKVFRLTPLDEARRNRYNEIVSLLEGTTVVSTPISRPVPQVVQQPIVQNISNQTKNVPVRTFPKLEETTVIVEEVIKRPEPKKLSTIEPVQIQRVTQVPVSVQTVQKQTPIFGAGAKSSSIPVLKKQTLDGLDSAKKSIGEVQTYKSKQINIQVLDQVIVSLEQTKNNILELRAAIINAPEK